VPAEFRFLPGPAAHDSACHFAEEKQVVPPEEIRDEASDDRAEGREKPHK